MFREDFIFILARRRSRSFFYRSRFYHLCYWFQIHKCGLYRHSRICSICHTLIEMISTNYFGMVLSLMNTHVAISTPTMVTVCTFIPEPRIGYAVAKYDNMVTVDLSLLCMFIN